MSTESPTPISIAVLISGSGSNLQAIIDALMTDNINANISVVISNKADAYGLTRAADAGIKTCFIDHRQYADRVSFDQAMIEEIDQYSPDLIILAGFMRILSDEFVNHYTGRMINIHPSLLPEFKGLHTHKRALEAGHKQHGASVHYVSNELDGGPVILQAEIDVFEDDTEESLRLRVLEQEHIIYPMVTRWFAERRLQLKNDKVLFDNQELKQALLLRKGELVNS